MKYYEASTLERRFNKIGNRGVERERYANGLIARVRELGRTRTEVARLCGLNVEQFNRYCDAISMPRDEIRDRIDRVLASMCKQ